MIWTLLVALLSSFAPASSVAMPAVPVVDSVEVSAVESAQADFEVGFGDLTTDAPVMAMFALPGERVPITVTRPAPEIDSASAS